MLFYHRWIDRNLTRLELVVSFIVILLFFGIFLRQSLVIVAMSEQTALNSTITNINSSLSVMAARYMLLNDTKSLQAMQGMNPMESLTNIQAELLYLHENTDLKENEFRMTPPSNYIGVRFAPEPDKLEAGIWYFDLSDNTLVYTVKNAGFFNSDIEGKPRAKFRVDLEYKDKNDNNRFDLPVDEFISVKLRKIYNYYWNFRYWVSGII